MPKKNNQDNKGKESEVKNSNPSSRSSNSPENLLTSQHQKKSLKPNSSKNGNANKEASQNKNAKILAANLKKKVSESTKKVRDNAKAALQNTTQKVNNTISSSGKNGTTPLDSQESNSSVTPKINISKEILDNLLNSENKNADYHQVFIFFNKVIEFYISPVTLLEIKPIISSSKDLKKILPSASLPSSPSSTSTTSLASTDTRARQEAASVSVQKHQTMEKNQKNYHKLEAKLNFLEACQKEHPKRLQNCMQLAFESLEKDSNSSQNNTKLMSKSLRENKPQAARTEHKTPPPSGKKKTKKSSEKNKKTSPKLTLEDFNKKLRQHFAFGIAENIAENIKGFFEDYKDNFTPNDKISALIKKVQEASENKNFYSFIPAALELISIIEINPVLIQNSDNNKKEIFRNMVKELTISVNEAMVFVKKNPQKNKDNLPTPEDKAKTFKTADRIFAYHICERIEKNQALWSNILLPISGSALSTITSFRIAETQSREIHPEKSDFFEKLLKKIKALKNQGKSGNLKMSREFWRKLLSIERDILLYYTPNRRPSEFKLINPRFYLADKKLTHKTTTSSGDTEDSFKQVIKHAEEKINGIKNKLIEISRRKLDEYTQNRQSFLNRLQDWLVKRISPASSGSVESRKISVNTIQQMLNNKTQDIFELIKNLNHFVSENQPHTLHNSGLKKALEEILDDIVQNLNRAEFRRAVELLGNERDKKEPENYYQILNWSRKNIDAQHFLEKLKKKNNKPFNLLKTFLFSKSDSIDKGEKCFEALAEKYLEAKTPEEYIKFLSEALDQIQIFCATAVHFGNFNFVKTTESFIIHIINQHLFSSNKLPLHFSIAQLHQISGILEFVSDSPKFKLLNKKVKQKLEEAEQKEPGMRILKGEHENYLVKNYGNAAESGQNNELPDGNNQSSEKENTAKLIVFKNKLVHKLSAGLLKSLVGSTGAFQYTTGTIGLFSKVFGGAVGLVSGGGGTVINVAGGVIDQKKQVADAEKSSEAVLEQSGGLIEYHKIIRQLAEDLEGIYAGIILQTHKGDTKKILAEKMAEMISNAHIKFDTDYKAGLIELTKKAKAQKEKSYNSNSTINKPAENSQSDEIKIDNDKPEEISKEKANIRYKDFLILAALGAFRAGDMPIFFREKYTTLNDHSFWKPTHSFHGLLDNMSIRYIDDSNPDLKAEKATTYYAAPHAINIGKKINGEIIRNANHYGWITVKKSQLSDPGLIKQFLGRKEIKPPENHTFDTKQPIKIDPNWTFKSDQNPANDENSRASQTLKH